MMKYRNLIIAAIAISEFIEMIGAYGIFKKCGRRPWVAFVPFVRHASMGKCAGRNQEGHSLMLISLGVVVMITTICMFKPNSLQSMISMFLLMLFMIPNVIYSIRVYFGLADAFGRNRLWVIPWFIFRCLCALLWGCSKNFKTAEGYPFDAEEAAPEVSGLQAEALDEGLSINITKRTAMNFFQRKVLLRDIHLSIPKGHMVLLLGGSGSGKTTFLNAVTGYEKAKAVITLAGSNVYKDYKSMKYDIGFVPQQDLVRGSDTVYRTLSDAALLRLPSEMRFDERRERINDVLNTFGLTPVKGSLVDKLSGGQRKRLSIAIEYISDPTLFILDEPDSGLDGVMARALFEKLRAIADSGKIVIVITHTPDRVADLFDDVIVVAKDANRTGRLAYYGAREKSYGFFGKKSMEEILMSVNRREEGGEGKADEFVRKYTAAVAGGEL